MTALYIIIAFIVGSIVGFRFCKFRYMIESMLELNRIQTSLINEEITAEEALERIKEIETKESL